MSKLKIAGVILIVVMVGIQFFPTSHNQSDEIFEADFLRTFDAPSDIAAIFKTSCYDCHSNNTNYPWYNKVQPSSWLLERHIAHAKEELNFSEFGDYSKRKQRSKLKSVVSQIKGGDMPLWGYTLIHRNARLTESERLLVTEWVDTLIDAL